MPASYNRTQWGLPHDNFSRHENLGNLLKIIDLSITQRNLAIVGQTTNQMKSMNDITLVTLCSAPSSLAPNTIITLVALDG